MPVIAGVMGPKAIARAAQWADGVDGAWTMDGDRDAMAAAFAQIRSAWEAAGRTEAPHLSSSIWYALGDGAEARLRDYAHTYMRIMGDASGRLGCRFGDLLHARCAERRGRPRARCRRRRVLPGADDVGSRRARAHGGCPRHLMDVDGLLEEVSAAVALDDYGDPTFRDGLDALWASGTKEADLNEIGMMALEAQVRMYLANRLRVREWHRTHPGLATAPVAAPLILVGHAS